MAADNRTRNEKLVEKLKGQGGISEVSIDRDILYSNDLLDHVDKLEVLRTKDNSDVILPAINYLITFHNLIVTGAAGPHVADKIKEMNQTTAPAVEPAATPG